MRLDYYDCCFCDLAEEGAQIGLLAMMAGISEELWCAGWMGGLEHSLWRMVEGGPRDYGMGEVSALDVGLLKALSDRCGGWWVYDDGPRFLRMERWLERLSAQVGAPEGRDALATREAESE